METKMVHRDITVIWVSMDRENRQSRVRFSYQVPETTTDLEICEEIYRQTNLYTGEIFNLILLLAPKDRPHTALSVNDHIVIDGLQYRCNDFGFGMVGAA
jgi:hypothetical protein